MGISSYPQSSGKASYSGSYNGILTSDVHTGKGELSGTINLEVGFSRDTISGQLDRSVPVIAGIDHSKLAGPIAFTGDINDGVSIRAIIDDPTQPGVPNAQVSGLTHDSGAVGDFVMYRDNATTGPRGRTSEVGVYSADMVP